MHHKKTKEEEESSFLIKYHPQLPYREPPRRFLYRRIFEVKREVNRRQIKALWITFTWVI